MPLDAILLSAAIVFVFLGFAAVLAWADFQTRPAASQVTEQPKRRRRSF